MPTKIPKLEFKNVTKCFGKTKALNHLNLIIPAHQIFMIVGPSGSGKSTLLKLINRLISLTKGWIFLDQKPISDYSLRKLRIQMGNVLQHIGLFPNLTVAQNITVQLKLKRVPKAKRLLKAKKLLKEVGLPLNFINRFPKQLSGGEQQRVGIARALVLNPKLILMDEPFSALDPLNRKALQDLVLRLHQKMNNTIVFVTHDMHEALRLGDQIAVLYQGRLLQVGTGRTLLEHPKTEIVTRLFHQKSILDIIKTGYGKVITSSTAKQVSPNLALSALARDLQENKIVQTSYNHQTYEITTKDFLNFMGKQVTANV